MSKSELYQSAIGHSPCGLTQGAAQAHGWITFEQMLQGLHAAGIYVHPDQLAEFLLFHGLPVHLRYVPRHLQQKAILVNENYRGDMAQLVDEQDDEI